MKNIAIEIKNVNLFLRKKQILENVTFNVYQGQFHGFIGVNGAGKTTLMRTIIGFYPNFSGNIKINNIENNDVKSKIKIGYMSERNELSKEFTVFEFLTMMANLTDLKGDEAKSKIEKLLTLVEFPQEFWNRKGNLLSSGQKRKILIAQALLNDPEVLLLDEPCANLDPQARVQLYELLSKLNKQGKTIFISSHILSELENYIDSYTILEAGKVKFSGKKENQNQEFPYKIETKFIDSIIEILNLMKEMGDKFNYKIEEKGILLNMDETTFNSFSEKVITSKIAFNSLGTNEKNLNQLYFEKK